MALKPHLIRYWLTPVVDEQADEKVSNINQLYQQAPQLAERGEAVVSIDELTGVQALERKHETKAVIGCQAAKQKGRTGPGKADYSYENIGQGIENARTPGREQDKHGNNHLQDDTHADSTPVNGVFSR